MFQNVVIALKQGVPQAPVIELATKAAPPPARLHLVTLVQVGREENVLEKIDEARGLLEKTEATLRTAGYDVTVVVGPVAMAAAADINNYTAREGADLVVIGLSKRTRVSKAVIGSDAQRVLLSSECPVLSAPVFTS